MGRPDTRPDAAIRDLLGQPISQRLFALLIDTDPSRVSHLVTAGTLRPGDTAMEWLHSYVGHLREVAAGRVGAEDGEDALDLVQERAKLAREQRTKLEMANAKTRGEQADIALLGEVLATASQAVAARIDALPAAIIRACPDLPSPVRKAIDTTVFEARREWSRQTAALVAQQLGADEEDDQDDDGGDD